MAVETLYHRNTSHLINTLTARQLINIQGATYVSVAATNTPNTVIFTSDVFVRSVGGTEVQIGSVVAQIELSATDTGSLRSATFNAPETELVSTDAVRVNERITNTSFTNLRTPESFITIQLNSALLNAVTWTFYRFTEHIIDPSEGNITALHFGSTSFNTRIENFTYGAAAGSDNNLFFCHG